ncbi:MAG: transglycosylase SLT domain-containing protein [Leptospirales bacterium]|nr:transglycosylase SLT domain-containing protein [Leptospirales bacterium]
MAFLDRASWLCVLAALLACAPELAAEGPESDIFAQLRGERWQEIKARYAQRAPQRFDERYALALATAHAESSPAAALAGITQLLQLAGIRCPSAELAQLQACLERGPRSEIASFSARLALWKAASIADSRDLTELSLALLGPISLEQEDPLNRKVYAQLIGLRMRKGDIAAAAALAESRRYRSAALDLLRGQVYLRNAQKDRAFPYLLAAARDSDADWQARSALQEIRRNFPGIFSGSEAPGFGSPARDLIALGTKLERAERESLRNLVSADQIVATTNVARLRGDGEFLALTGQAPRLPQLAERSYTFLSQQPHIVDAWSALLIRNGQKQAALNLLRQHRHLMPARPAMWQRYIELLEEDASNDALLDELIAYLKANPSNFAVQDSLVRLLIGPDAEHIRWAPEQSWRKTQASLPPGTARGRFVYWYHRYLQENNQAQRAQELAAEFYRWMPGSFYSGAFWDLNRGGDYARDWHQVSGKESYYQWLSRYGGREEAWRFLARQDPARYQSYDGLRLWKAISSGEFDPPEEIVALYRLGETGLGAEFFEERYRNRLTRLDRSAVMAALGLRSGHLNISVYYARLYMRESGMAEDPFTQPAPLLKSLYPRPYRREVQQNAAQYNISEYAVYALMRQESMFVERAVSRSGARGLMQIMPATGRWLARRFGAPGADFSAPALNIKMGAAFFADLMRSNSGDFRWAAIAYNGGPGNLRKWKRDLYKGDFYHFLEALPSEEARNYCRVTYQNFLHYGAIYSVYPEE